VLYILITHLWRSRAHQACHPFRGLEISKPAMSLKVESSLTLSAGLGDPHTQLQLSCLLNWCATSAALTHLLLIALDKDGLSPEKELIQ
jgi:hypothetical protein